MHRGFVFHRSAKLRTRSTLGLLRIWQSGIRVAGMPGGAPCKTETIVVIANRMTQFLNDPARRYLLQVKIFYVCCFSRIHFNYLLNHGSNETHKLIFIVIECASHPFPSKQAFTIGYS